MRPMAASEGIAAKSREGSPLEELDRCSTN